MERNYDELFAEMLMSIDRHTEELDKHSKELTRVSAELTRVSLEASAEKIKHDQAHERMMQRLDESEKNNNTFHDRHLEMIVNTATILDRIIKKNNLRL